MHVQQNNCYYSNLDNRYYNLVEKTILVKNYFVNLFDL